MQRISFSQRTDALEKIRTAGLNGNVRSNERTGINPLLENILSEGGEDFFQYLTWIGLAKEPDLMVLSSVQHYHYDHNDLIGIKALINLKKLNQIRHPDSFLHTLFRIMPANTYFAGYFKRNPHGARSSIYSRSLRFLSELVKHLNPGSETYLSGKIVKGLLEGNGFKVLDMTEINGITYFWAQNCRRPGE
jgi:hypothetical protein